MSGHPIYPPRDPGAPRRLYRSRSDRMLGGVCAGIADYLRVDPALVRLVTVVVTLFTGAPVLAYLIAVLVIPDEPRDTPPTPRRPARPAVRPSMEREMDPVWGPLGAPWEQPEPDPAPRSAGSSPFRPPEPPPQPFHPDQPGGFPPR